MIDWKRVIAEPEAFKNALKSRGYAPADSDKALSQIQKISEERAKWQKQLNTAQEHRNKTSEQVGLLMREGKKSEAEALKIKAKEIGDEMATYNKEFEKLDDEFRNVLDYIANWPHESVPVGTSAADNKIVRDWGEKRNFDFQPKAHDEIGEKLGLLDFGRAVKVSGARFAFLRSGLAQLERALANFMLDTHRAKGYEEIVPPYIVTSQTFYGIGQFPKFKEDVFKLENEDKYLIPTSEVPITSFFADEILSEDILPKKFVAFSPCFRSEAGSYGKDTKGLIRQHQFHKVEMVKFTKPEDSLNELEAMTQDAESILQALKIPYRVMLLCTGDMGNNAQKTYDIEVWLPGSVHEADERGCYREISSCSDCSDYQARRSKIRFKGKDKGTRLVHTLNGSGLAVGRTLVAVLENYQQKDGSVLVPEVLLPYMGGLKVIK
ncbi:MAG: serine--tRNA ligase [Bdellovibrionota bacterium]